jgi:hypothetical protein
LAGPSAGQVDAATDGPATSEGGALGYRGRVGSNQSSGTSMSIPVGSSGVPAGDAVVIFVLINNNVSGAVTVKDAALNTYTVAVDTADGTEGDRFVALAAAHVKALAGGTNIDLTLPASAFAAAEDFASVTAVGSMFGTGGGSCTSFSTGTVTTSASELLVGAAAVESGAGSWVSGWTSLPAVVGPDGDTITPAYRLGPTAASSPAGSCSGNGWMAALLSLR